MFPDVKWKCWRSVIYHRSILLLRPKCLPRTYLIDGPWEVPKPTMVFWYSSWWIYDGLKSLWEPVWTPTWMKHGQQGALAFFPSSFLPFPQYLVFFLGFCTCVWTSQYYMKLTIVCIFTDPIQYMSTNSMLRRRAVPAFRNGQYGFGIYNVVMAVADRLRDVQDGIAHPYRTSNNNSGGGSSSSSSSSSSQKVQAENTWIVLLFFGFPFACISFACCGCYHDSKYPMGKGYRCPGKFLSSANWRLCDWIWLNQDTRSIPLWLL